MKTIVQSIPQWLRVRIQKPPQPKLKALGKKDRQVLPTLPNQSQPRTIAQDESPPGYRVLWHH